MKECKIIRDLMPNYIDGLASQESREYIEEHLKTCTECTNYLNEMKSQVELNGKETIKEEVDYMKKAKKKMKIGEKLITIIGLLLVIIGMLFWREIYQGILFADICRKHLFWHNQVMESGAYKLIVTDYSSTQTYYYSKEKTVIESWNLDDEETHIRAIYNESDIPNSKILVQNVGETPNIRDNGSTIKIYTEIDPEIGDPMKIKEEAYLPYFNFEEISFWNLMKGFKDVITIRILNDGASYLLYMKNGEEIWINRNTGIVEIRETTSNENYSFRIIEPDDERLQYPNNEEYIVLHDYEDSKTRSTKETNVKISNCEEEAGKIVSYDFKIENNGNNDLTWFVKTNYENLRILKITNNYTYKKMQERWTNLRDLTDKDFENYFVLLVIDTDNSRQIHFKDYGGDDEADVNEQLAKKVVVTETEAEEEYMYSGSLIVIPNSMDAKFSNLLSFRVSLED